jgi:hypothetical protein
LRGRERLQFERPVKGGSLIVDSDFPPCRGEAEDVDLQRPGASGQIVERVLACIVGGSDDFLFALRSRNCGAGDSESARADRSGLLGRPQRWEQ